jgi:hypothetical protein
MNTTATRVGNGKGRFRAYVKRANGELAYAGSSATYANADKMARRLAGKLRGATAVVEDAEAA